MSRTKVTLCHLDDLAEYVAAHRVQADDYPEVG